MRTIRITGKGQLKLRPDTTRITMTLEGLDKDYEATLKRSSDDTEALKELLTGFGFQKSDVKTLQFSVNTEYESYREGDEYRQRFAGYRFRHVMKVEFPSDNARLGRILYALAGAAVRPEFRLSYTVGDPEAAKKALLAKAVADAREKAAVLTEAAGVALGQLRSIDYSWGTLSFECAPMDNMVMARKSASLADGAFDLDIEPDDIEVSDTVTVIWEIE
ncbi:MAG: SIMPL domain-containing protein [Oscillospiraceae bacterium]|nr:SIMPL domain-containing protein [Oscillospiraceae bacterium]